MPCGSASAFMDASGFADALASSTLECSNALAFDNASGFSVVPASGDAILAVLGALAYAEALAFTGALTFSDALASVDAQRLMVFPSVSSVLTFSTNLGVASPA
uniref:Uncharacterized protein n=1 Tax=Rhipicephalus zambeziensis TaxID=60191 RepID=A0A224Y5N0_9ACAR